ncbi:MAG: FkbM family methyltransferase [Ginsengibacter sp.]
MISKIELYYKINRLLNSSGFDLRRFPGTAQRILIKYLNENNITHCFDVGANIGQYGRYLRSIGFKGKIFSFEPQKKVFNQLHKRAARDSNWQVYNIGLGNANEKRVINISKNSVSSSILEINPLLVKTIPETEYVFKEDVLIERIDYFIKAIDFQEKFFLKIDAQGFESKILEGAEGCIKDIYALQIELSCISLYKEEKLFDEMKGYIESKGFFLSSIENGFADHFSGRLLQIEAIFLRDS